jgi:hypothetical protein
MEKKGANGVIGEGSAEGEMEAMKLRLQKKLEEMIHEQSKDLKAKVVSS